jgi:hypothetical protein
VNKGATVGVQLLDPDLVRRICGVATVRDIVYDALDDSFWVRLSPPAKAGLALTALNTYGIGGHDLEDGRLHVTGWDDRLLHCRLGGLLAGVDDLRSEWSSTAELVCYHYDRRVAAGVEPDVAEILADVEGVIRSYVPIPHQAPRVEDVAVSLELVAAAEDAYQQLIEEHVEYAEHALTTYIGRRHSGAA